jgi:hypothetical protein
VHKYPSGETTNPDPDPSDCPDGNLLLLLLLLFESLEPDVGHTDVTNATDGPHFLTTPVTDLSDGVKSFSNSSTDVENLYKDVVV